MTHELDPRSSEFLSTNNDSNVSPTEESHVSSFTNVEYQ